MRPLLPVLLLLATPCTPASAQSARETLLALPAEARHTSDAEAPLARPRVPGPAAERGAVASERLPRPPAELALARTGVPLDRVHYDSPGDGNLWAMGAAYKARFGADGVRYIPYLGPDAPANRPLDLTLQAVTIGGQPLAFEARAAAAREGDVVHFDRGSLTEYYVMAPETVEQCFRFDDLPLGAAGDLVLEIGVATDLALAPVDSAQDPGCFEWTSALGSVRYGRATVVDGGGASSLVPTRFVEGAIEIRVPAHFVAGARLPLIVDPVLSTFDVNSSSFFDLLPDIAYDRQTGRWGIVWSRLFSAGDWDVWCETRSFIGSYIEGAFIDMTDVSWIDARIGGNRFGSQFLVVAEVGPTGNRTIGGRTREAENTSMSGQIDISDSVSGEKLNPDVGGDPHNGSASYYLVVWEHVVSTGNHDIHGQLVDRNPGNVGDLIQIASSSSHELAPAVNNSNGELVWTVAYEREFTPTEADIFATQIGWSGTIIHPSFSVDLSSADDRRPSVSSPLDGSGGTAPYLVVYVRNHGNDRNIQGTVLQGNNGVSASTNLTQLLGPASAFLDQNWPSVDSDGSTFVLAHAQQEVGSTNNNVVVSAMTLADGQLLRAEQTTPWGASPMDDSAPRIFSQRSGGGPDTFVFGVWSRSSDIEGGRYGSPGAGDVFCTSFPHSGGNRARLAADGSISLTQNSLSLLVRSGPANRPGLFFLGSNQVSVPFGEGRRCVGGAVHRIQPLAHTDAQGFALRSLDTGLPYGSALFPGAPGVNFQFWFRDPQGGPAGFNYSDALHIEFQP